MRNKIKDFANRNKAATTIGIITAALFGAMVLSTFKAPVMFDTEPTTVFTAPARTARPTRAPATVTGTVGPTPTGAGVHVYTNDAMETPAVNCSEAAATGIPETWNQEVNPPQDGNVYDANFYICNLNAYPVTLRVRQYSEVLGFSGASSESFLCEPNSAVYCDPAQAFGWLTAVSTSVPCPVGGGGYTGYQRSMDRTMTQSFYTWRDDGGTVYNDYHGTVAGGSSGDCGGGGPTGELTLGYDVDLLWDSNPSSGATATPDPSATPWITEILARPQGTVCGDWNLRGGCGDNDQFVEVGVGTSMSLSGYRVEILDGSANVVCGYTIKSDNLTAPLKAFWQDYMTAGNTPTPAPTPTGTPTPTVSPTPAVCGQWPETGSAKLYDADGVLLDTRAYDYSGGGQYGDSWAAMDWTNPAGPWWWYSPSPGKGNRVPPTATPTP